MITPGTPVRCPVRGCTRFSAMDGMLLCDEHWDMVPLPLWRAVIIGIIDYHRQPSVAVAARLVTARLRALEDVEAQLAAQS